MKHIPKDISDPIFEEIEDDLYMETLLPLMKNKYKTIKAKNDYERSMKLIRFALGLSLIHISSALPNALSYVSVRLA